MDEIGVEGGRIGGQDLGMGVRVVCSGFVSWSFTDVGLNCSGISRYQVHI